MREKRRLHESLTTGLWIMRLGMQEVDIMASCLAGLLAVHTFGFPEAGVFG